MIRLSRKTLNERKAVMLTAVQSLRRKLSRRSRFGLLRVIAAFALREKVRAKNDPP
jgi:hypothetical protein